MEGGCDLRLLVFARRGVVVFKYWNLELGFSPLKYLRFSL